MLKQVGRAIACWDFKKFDDFEAKVCLETAKKERIRT